VTAGPARPRDQYIDGLRALALVRVMAYHTFGWIWLPVLFPSMGVMFALGGSLVAASLSASAAHSRVLRKRVKRLLPPLWLYGTVLVPVMLWQGWTVTEQAGTPLGWRTALYWIVPLADPPGSAWGYDFVLPLWYIRTYLWLLLLSPALLWLFRRYPWPVLAAPAVLLLASGQGLLDTSTRTGDTVQHLATFGACWVLGFAHHDGRIARLPGGRTVAGALGLMAAGLAFALTHQQLDTRWDIDDIDPANALYSAGAVLLLLRLYPRRTFLERTPRLSRLVSAMNSRAMTIYLWGNVCIWAATPVIESNPWTEQLQTPGLRGQLLKFAVAWLVLGVVVLAVGWAEDVAAGRAPRLVPWPRTQRVPARTVRRPGPALTAMAVAVSGVLVVGVLVVPTASLSGGTGIAALPVAGPITPGPDAPFPARYPWHTGIEATVFWIGAVTRTTPGDDDGQSLASAWDSRWAEHYGGCDGSGTTGAACGSDVANRVAPDFFPTTTVPQENPYYVGLPYNDLISSKSTDRHRLGWAADPGFAVRLFDRSVSFVKNRWVGVRGPRGTCYAQVEDVGPGVLDPDYVLGTARPRSVYGINLSPAVYRCVGLQPDAGSGTVAWRFVDAPEPGPWARLITTRQVS
jgi:peptidoglycan/LPS O-acetylase OafA/YrhL